LADAAQIIFFFFPTIFIALQIFFVYVVTLTSFCIVYASLYAVVGAVALPRQIGYHLKGVGFMGGLS